MNNIILYSLLSYFIGSISGSLLLGKFWKIDIRKFGSNSTGGTNAFRIVGFTFGLLTTMIDILKGLLPAYLMGYISGQNELQMMICSFSAIFGHVFPVFYRFNGGKGAGTTVGALIILAPESLIYVLPTFIIVLVLSGFVGLSTITATFVLLIYSIIMLTVNFVWFSLFILLFIIFTHRKNIQRMIRGNENRFSKIMLFKR